jgi:4-hydroxy-3-methylbut-2-enyl diphosphate reductase
VEIIVARTAGFCFGVKRAIKLAEECAEENGGGIYTLGPIIHNPQVVKKLEAINVRAIDDIDAVERGTVIIRSHGVKLSDHKSAVDKGLTVVDATCPFVKKTQEYVSELTADGYTVIVVGEGDHPEVKGIMSYGGPAIRVVTSPDELKDMPRVKKIGVVAQTTQSIKNLEAVVSACLSKAAEVKVHNTICNATSLRQTESVDIALMADVMIIAGGKNSANTKRLAEICRAIRPRTHHIEIASELAEAWFEGASRVGVTAGASTPRWVIEEVLERLRRIAAEQAGARFK